MYLPFKYFFCSILNVQRFKNGVLDMLKNEILPHDPKYRFTTYIGRDYEVELGREELKSEIMRRLFNKQFTDLTKRDFMLEKLARGFAGTSSYVDKQFQFFIGETNCGKGKLRELCMTGFEEYVKCFNANNLLLSGNGTSQDDEKDKKWIIDFCEARMAISNEINMRTETEKGPFGAVKKLVAIDGEVLKMLASAGDPIMARKLHANSFSVVNKANICLFVNDCPTVKPVDEAYLKRANYITFDRSSDVSIKEDTETHFPADERIDDFVSDVKTGDAFVSMMCDYYRKSVENGMMKRPDCVIHQSRELAGAGEESMEWIKTNYEIHENPRSFLREEDGMVD